MPNSNQISQKDRPINQRRMFSFLLIAISISIGIGPLFLFIFSPNNMIENNRLDADTYFTPIIMVILFISTLIYGKLGKYIIRNSSEFIPLFGLWLIMLLSSIIYSRGAYMTLNLPFLGAVLFFMCSRGIMLEHPEIIDKALLAYIYTCGIVSIFYLILINTPFAIVSQGRYFFLGENPNSYSTRLATSFVCSLFFLKKKNVNRNILIVLFLMSQLYIIFLSGSRGALFTLLIGSITYLISLKQIKGLKIFFNYRFIIFAVMMTIILLVIFSEIDFSETSMVERLTDFFESKNTGGRTQLWNDTFNIFIDNPIIGVGTDGFRNEMLIRFGEQRDAHNLFLYILSTSGVIGTLAFLAFLLPMALSSMQSQKNQFFSLTIFIVIISIAFRSGGILAYSLLWYLFAICSAQNKIGISNYD